MLWFLQKKNKQGQFQTLSFAKQSRAIPANAGYSLGWSPSAPPPSSLLVPPSLYERPQSKPSDPLVQKTRQFVSAAPPSRQKSVAPVLHLPVRQMAPSVGNQNQRRSLLLLVGTSLVIVVVVGIWFGTRSFATDVTLYQVGIQDVTQQVGGGGIIAPRQLFELSYPASERVTDIYVKAGDSVVPGQRLLRLDPTQLNAQVKQAADDMVASQAFLDSVSTSGSPTSIAQAQRQYDLARNRYNALLAQVSFPLQHGGDLISPLRGAVTNVFVNSGEVFEADKKLVTIMDEAVVVVRAKVPLINISQIEIGQRAIVSPSALPHLTFEGIVSSKIPQADPQTETFEVWVSVDNAKRELVPGMSAFVSIQTSNKAFVLPRLSVLNPDHGSTVFVVQNDCAYIRRIRVVGRSGDTLLVSEGLSAGDKVVLVGTDKLRDGQKIHIRTVEV